MKKSLVLLLLSLFFIITSALAAIATVGIILYENDMLLFNSSASNSRKMWCLDAKTKRINLTKKSLNHNELFIWDENQQKTVLCNILLNNKTISSSSSSSSSSSIPKIIIQTFKNNVLPTNMFNATNSIRSSNLDFQYEYFDDKRCKKWLHSNFSDPQLAERIERAFDMLIPGAFKADIFRLAVLYELGGVYIDISMCVTDTCNLSISNFLGSLPSRIEHVLVKDKMYDGIYQAFIMSKPKSDLILYILESITTQVLDKYEPPPKMKGRSLAYTGPLAFAKFLRQFWNLPKDHEFEYGTQKHDNSTYILQFKKSKWYKSYGFVLDNNKKTPSLLLQSKYHKWKNDRPEKSHYSILSKKNQIYKKSC